MNLDALWSLALAHAAQGRMAQAAEAFGECARRAPASPDAWNNLGAALQALGRFPEAEDAHRHALALDPSNPDVRSNLGHALFKQDRLAEAEEELSPLRQHPDALFNLALALRRAEKYDAAMAAYDALLALAPGHARARALRAMALLEEGRYAEGWAAYECRWELPEFRSAPFPSLPRWDGRTRLHLRLDGEQGFGDAIQMLRFVPALAERSAGLSFAFPPPLRPLLEAQGWRDAPGTPEAQLPVMSLPRVLDLRPEQLPGPMPCLRADPERVRAWEARLGPAGLPLVGLAWSGNPAYESDIERSLPFEALSGLLALPGIRWVSLQREALGQAALPGLFDAGPLLTDFGESAAILACLDLLVSVDTAVPHLAGALGLESWLLLPRPCDWRWGREGERSAWYPSHRLFRQSRPGAWGPCLEAVARELAAWRDRRR